MCPLQDLLIASGDPSQRIYHSTTPSFGNIEIKTMTGMAGMVLTLSVEPNLNVREELAAGRCCGDDT